MIIDDEYLSWAFEEGDRLTQRPGAIRLMQQPIGELQLPTGRIVVCDPLVTPDTAPLDVVVPTGTFPVVLTIAEIGADQRIAFARVEFAPARSTSWTHVAWPGQDVAALPWDEQFGYDVDSGTGCFMDGDSAAALLQEDRRFFDKIDQTMQRNYADTRSWAIVSPGNDPRFNVICFTSGYGDGNYASFLGMDDQGSPVCLLTDFQVFEGTQPR